MVINEVSQIQKYFYFISKNREVYKTHRAGIEYYLIVTEENFNVVVSYEYADNKWNLYITFNKSEELESISYNEYISLSGKKQFYTIQNKFLRKKVGLLRSIFTSRKEDSLFIEFFAKYIKENMNYISSSKDL
jgi:hypothetical protein